jgi:hypothetical protein
MNRPVIHLHRMAGATRDPEMMAIYRRRDLRETRHVVIGPTVTWSARVFIAAVWVVVTAYCAAIWATGGTL